jgi:hypothetical protein
MVGLKRPCDLLTRSPHEKLAAKTIGFSSLGQNQLAQTRGLQAVSGAVVADFHCLLPAQKFGTVQATG